MRYFSGEGHSLGTVAALSQSTFADFCTDHVERPQRLTLTRQEFLALPEKDHKAPMDQNRAKYVRYVTPATFNDSPARRVTENAVRCNLIILDIDETKEAKRLLTQRWDDCLGGLGFAVWNTARSTEETPRLRILVHAEGISPSRYVAAARTVAEKLGMSDVDYRVTFQSTQPAFLPTACADDPEEYSPVVAINKDGDPFLPSDILDDSDSALVDTPPAPGSQELANLEFLRQPMDGITLNDAAAALEHLDPDLPMQAWIETAAGLKHQFSGKKEGEKAYALWDKWSAKGTKYVDAAETLYRWNSLKAQPTDRAPVTIRSLFKAAQARGWTNPALASAQLAATINWLKDSARSAEQLIDEGVKRVAKIGPVVSQIERKVMLIALKDAMASRGVPVPLPDIRREVRQLELDAARSTGIPPWAKGLCFVTALNVFYRHTTDRRFLPEVLDLMYSTPQIGEDKPPRPRDYLIQIANCPVVENLLYEPSHGKKKFFTVDSVPYVNTYRACYAPPEIERAEEAGDMYLAHLEHLIAEPAYREILTSFIAFMVQKPGVKIRWAPLIQSAEGGGKTVLHAICQAILGTRNVFKMSGPGLMESDFNSWAYGRQLVTIEEIRVVGANRHAVMDKLKTPITDDDISYHKKHADHLTVKNITNYLMFTNYMDALAVRDDGRRYFVVSSPLQHPEQIEALGGAAYFRKLYGMIRDNPGGLRAWFESYSISKLFDPDGRAVATPYLTELADNAASPLTHAVKTALSDGPHPLVKSDLVSLGCLRGCLDTQNMPNFSDQALAGVLRELGWTKFERVLLDGAKHQLWTHGRMRDPRRTAEKRLRLEDLI